MISPAIELAVWQAIIDWNRSKCIGPGSLPPLDIDLYEEGELAEAVLAAIKNTAPQVPPAPRAVEENAVLDFLCDTALNVLEKSQSSSSTVSKRNFWNMWGKEG